MRSKLETELAVTVFEKKLTSNLSKYCISSGFSKGRFPFGCMSTTETLLSGVCILNPIGVPAIGVGVAVSLRAGVRIGTYPARKQNG